MPATVSGPAAPVTPAQQLTGAAESASPSEAGGLHAQEPPAAVANLNNSPGVWAGPPVGSALPVAAACDGAYRGNPRRGGWGWLIRLSDGRTLEASGGQPDTTNNRMELEALAGLLEALAGLPRPAGSLVARTDSRYVTDGLTRHLPRWRRNGWRTIAGQPVKNRDLWERLAAAAAAVPWVALAWVKGHNGDPDNERADAIATAAADRVAVEAATTAGPAVAPPIGSAWDAGASADGIRPAHLREWVEGSAVAPALAAANLVSLAGWEVLEALRGDRLEQLAGQAHQYATGAVGRVLRPLEAVADAGGWWADGLDPLADWAPMRWGCFKPDRPRVVAADGGRGFKPAKHLKYEHPSATPTRAFWLRVPASVALLVADRHGLELPPEVAADSTGARGTFWRWWAATPTLPLLVCEGAKKAAAALSIGLPAVGLPGIDNGAPRPMDPTTGKREGRPELLADLAGVPLAQRPVWVAFDYSDKPAGRQAVSRALDRLGGLLQRAGAAVLVGACPGPHKGLDDALAAGVAWEAIAQQLEPLQAAPVLPRLRRPDRLAPAGQWLGEACPLPEPEAVRLVALAAPMGAGKTEAIAAAVAAPLAAGVPVLAPTHRASLGEALARRLGLPWAAPPGDDLRLQGLGLCWDSACPSSGLRIKPGEWGGADGRGPVVVADEIAQGVEHLLFGHGTAIGERRPEVLETVAQLLRSARQVIAADAQISEPVLRLLEALTGTTAQLIASEAQPMAGRRLVCPRGLTPAKAGERARSKLAELIAADAPLFCWSTAQRADAANAPQNLAAWHLKRRPGARVLVVDSEHPDAAAQLLAAAAADADADRLEASGQHSAAAAQRAQGVGQWHAVYVSPAIASGLSIGLRGHFAAVVVLSGGHVGPEHVAQAAARVRDPAVPVFVFAPAKAPGDALRVGSGATDAADLLRHLRRLEPQLLADLTAAAGWEPSASNESPWLRCWLELAALRNRQRLAYAATIAGLLEREGWEVVATDGADPEAAAAAATAAPWQSATAELQAIAEQAQALEDAATIAACLPDAQELADLQRRRQLSADERAQLRRHRIATGWGLGESPPSVELLAADRDGLGRRLRFGWLLGSIEGRQLAATHDAKRREQLAPNGRAWSPDLARELLGHRLAAADVLGLPAWLERRDWFTKDDAQLLELQGHFAERPRPDGPEPLDAEASRRAANARAREDAACLRTVLGVSPGLRAITTLRALLLLAGHRLEAKRSRGPDGLQWRYRVAPINRPAGVDPEALRAAWIEQLRHPDGPGGVPKNPH